MMLLREVTPTIWAQIAVPIAGIVVAEIAATAAAINYSVIPAKAGIQIIQLVLDSRLHGNDNKELVSAKKIKKGYDYGY